MKLSKKIVVPGGVAGALVAACAVCCAPLVVPLVSVMAAIGTGTLGLAALRRFRSRQDGASVQPVENVEDCACPAACANAAESQCRSPT